jgi:CRISPR/Cas system CSM-associated protein Csm2 small subunit
MASARPELTSHQVRRFFQHCRRIQARLRAGSTWPTEEADFRKIDAFAADARARKTAPPLFEDFVRRNVAAVRDERDFTKGFMAHFEALLGFGARYFKKQR